MLICIMSSNIFAEPLVCPKTIEVKESVMNTPKGWTAVSDGIPHPLKGVEFFEGNPEKLGGLSPEQENPQNGLLYSIWDFDPKTAKNLWVSCTYGRTAMTLARPVNKVYKRCTVKSNMMVMVDGQPELMSIECK